MKYLHFHFLQHLPDPILSTDQCAYLWLEHDITAVVTSVMPVMSVYRIALVDTCLSRLFVSLAAEVSEFSFPMVTT